MASVFIDLPVTGGGAAGVSSLNSLTGALTLVGGSGITVTPSGSNITIAATGAGSGTVTSVALTVPSFLSVSGSPITTSGTLAVSLSGTALPILNGGTGQTTASAAFGALSPLTTKGDLLGFSTVNARTPVGADGFVLTADSTQTLGLKWAAVSGTGTVTSVALSDGSTTPIYAISGSPVTASGTLTFTLSTQTANKVFASATSGGAAQPTFRALVSADIPSLPYASSTLTNTHIFVGNGSNVATDVALSGDATLANTGAITLASVVSASTNTKITYNAKGLVTAGAAAVLASADFVNQGTTTTVLHGNAAGNPSFGAVVLTTDVSGSLPIANAGTNITTYTTGDVLYASATNVLSKLGIGSTGNVLTVAGGIPSWAAPATSGTVTSVAMTVPTFLSVSGSPITSSGTLAVTLSGTALPIANGGTGQTSANPAFNALSPLTTKGDILSFSTVNARLGVGSDGQVLTADSTQTLGVKWAAAGGSGTVTSVALSSPGVVYTVSGSPVTTSGTLALNLIAQIANTHLAGPTSGGSANPTFRALVVADMPATVAYTNVDNMFTVGQTANGISTDLINAVISLMGI